jgi:opacity protein-like surface antigen
MRKIVLFVILVLALSVCSVAADDAPKAEVFGGYSLLRANINGADYNTNGWDGAVTGNLNRYFGVTADISGQYRTVTNTGLSTTLHETHLLVRPDRFLSREKVEAVCARPVRRQPWGIFSGTSFATQTQNVFAMEFGGGVDIKVAKHVALRPVELDWRRTSFASSTQNNLRYLAGIVLNLGGK